MKNRRTLTKFLAFAGTAIAWFPIVAPVLLSAVLFIAKGIFRFDYLMPAELFPAALAGGGLLLWAAVRARSRRKTIGWGLGIAVASLAGAQALAAATGLASGETEPAGVWFLLTLSLLVAYIVALIVAGVGGALLVRDLLKATAKE